MFRLSRTFEGVRLTALHFRLERRPCFHYINGIHEQASSRQKASDSGQFGIVVPLVGFNLGVEVGQLCVAAIVLPILWKLRRNPGIRAPMGSSLFSRYRVCRQLLD